MKISFLNVGQGDSLVLQWTRNEKNKVGIIDCKNDQPINSTITYLESLKPERIDFIILTHPHSDHFSGLIELIGYLVKKEIPIDHFYTTATLSPNRILMSIKGRVATNEVTQLFKTLHTLSETDKIQMYFMSETAFDMKLNDEWNLKIMSPSVKELNTYSSTAKYSVLHQDEEPDNEPKGNLLSTVFALHNDQGYFLLTSDSIDSVFYRIDKQYRDFFGSKKLLLGQIPHHGSTKNFKSDFWKKKNPEKKPIPAVISVGKNRYDHPSEQVLDKLNDLGYEICVTEPIANFKDTVNNTKSLLNTISSSVLTKSTSKGVFFSFNKDVAVKEIS